MSTPSISQGQIAIDPVNGILYYKTRTDQLVNTSLNLLQESANLIATEDSLEVGGDFVVSGDFTVSGNTVTLNTQTLLVEDNIIVLNSNVTGTPTVNAGIEINRGNVANVQIIWNESTENWQFTNDGINYYNIGTLESGSINDLADVVLSNSASGDFLRYNGSVWINDPVNLSTDTIGDYVANITAGAAITIANAGGENANPTISVTANTFDSYGSANTAYANAVSYANSISANTYSNAVAYVDSRTLDNLFDVNVSTAANGDFLRYNGNTWINDPVNLSTDTVGNYVQSLVSGTGVFLSNNSGEGSTPTISIGQDVSANANVSFNTVTANFVGNITGNVSSISTHNIDELADVVISSAQNGQLLQYNGSAWVNNVMPSSEPIGHENKAQSAISFNEGSREFSIAPVSGSYTVWCKGIRHVKTTTETISIPDTSGLYYIYFSNTGVLSYKTTYFDWENDTPTAYIYWNQNDDKAYFVADERHGVTLDWATHEYLHRTRGAVIASGFGANGYTTTGDGSIDAHAVISIANGTFFDEDLQVDITHSATPTANTWEQRLQANAYIPIFYHLNTHWKKDTATQFPMKQGTARVQYNRLNGGTWSTVDIDNNKWGITWIVATNNLNEPVLGVLGQEVYLTIGDAESAVWEDLNLDGFPVFEFRPLYKVIYQTANAYANTPHATIQGVIDLRRVISSDQGIPTTPVSDHGSMTGLSDDDHAQYLNTDRHDLHDHTVALSTASINDLSDVTLNSSTNGDFLRFNGSVWVNDAVNLSTDTIGDYIANIVAGDAIDISNTGGEGATPTISVAPASIDANHISLTFQYVEDVVAGNNIIVTNNNFGPGLAGNISVATSATPSFESISANTLTISGIGIDPFGAASGQVLKFNGTKFIADQDSVADGTTTKYTQVIGNGLSNTAIVNHNLGTRSVTAQVYDNVTFETVEVSVKRTTVNYIEVTFSANIPANAFTVVVVG
jgi:hypothetical protein